MPEIIRIYVGMSELLGVVTEISVVRVKEI
jgi:hypothetical protein